MNKSRTVVELVLLTAALLPLVLSSPAPTPGAVSFVGSNLVVDSEPYFIQGLCYSPVPSGESPLHPPFGDYFTADYAYIWKRDLPLIAKLGINTIRIYGWDTTHDTDHGAFLDECYKNNLKVLLTFYVGLATDNPPVLVNSPAARQVLYTNFTRETARYGDHPAILLWSFGNELNGVWNGFAGQFSDEDSCNWNGYDQSCYNSQTMDPACMAATDCMYKGLFGFINEAAKQAKQGTSRPIISGFADIDRLVDSDQKISKFFLFDHYLPDIQAYAIQLYRGASFGSYFDDYKANTANNPKPLFITEYGVDAYNDPCGWAENDGSLTCTNIVGDGSAGGVLGGADFEGCKSPPANDACLYPGAVTQAGWDVGLSLELMDNYPKVDPVAGDTGGLVVGGFLMAWEDEFWKGALVPANCKIPCPIDEIEECLTTRYDDYKDTNGKAGCSWKAHITCRREDSTQHGLCGYHLYSAPDFYVNEEWFGVTTPVSCNQYDETGNHGLDSLDLSRPVLKAMQEIWAPEEFAKKESLTVKSCAELLLCWTCIHDHYDATTDPNPGSTTCAASCWTVPEGPTPAPVPTPSPTLSPTFSPTSAPTTGPTSSPIPSSNSSTGPAVPTTPPVPTVDPTADPASSTGPDSTNTTGSGAAEGDEGADAGEESGLHVTAVLLVGGVVLTLGVVGYLLHRNKKKSALLSSPYYDGMGVDAEDTVGAYQAPSGLLQ